CPHVRFHHIYDNGANRTIFDNYFPLTAVNESSTMGHLCVDQNGLPVMRRCLGHNKWEKLKNITCQFEMEANELSQRLNKLKLQLNEELPALDETYRNNVVYNTSQLLGKAKNKIQPVDVVNVNKIIDAVTKEKTKTDAVSSAIIGLYDQLMDTDSTVLELSARLNATNSLLYNFEGYMDKLGPHLHDLKSCKPQNALVNITNLVDMRVAKGLQILVSQKLSVFYIFPDCNQYTGIAIYNRPGPNRLNCFHHYYWYRLLYAHESVDNLKAEPGLQTATFLSHELWQSVKSAGATYLIFKIYANNAFFIEKLPPEKRSSLQSHVLSISIPQVLNELPHQLVFLLRNLKQAQVLKESPQLSYYCGYWDYVGWQTNGVTTRQNNASQDEDAIVVCLTNHLTQFGLLVGSSFKQLTVQADAMQLHHECILDMVTAVGCGLSLFGLMAIWLTAMLSDRWRSQHATKLLLNLSLAMTLLFGMLLLVYINEWVLRFAFNVHRVACIALGAALQYLVLLLFTWMLLIGYLQYRRHVTVLGVRSEHVVLHMAIIAWLVPLLPTLLLLFLDRKSYAPILYRPGDIATVCYPSGTGLIYSILLPIGSVLIINSYVLCRIIHSVSRLRHRNRQLVWQQLNLFMLLFSLLGLTWIFGICSYFRLGLVFNYLFCIMGTVQGFILFVYFILLETKARNVWLKLL
ncbi:hypothetical protein KR215_001238, partial [Drosophila sulfurigaster]